MSHKERNGDELRPGKAPKKIVKRWWEGREGYQNVLSSGIEH